MPDLLQTKRIEDSMEHAKTSLPNRWLVFVIVVIGSIGVGIAWMKVTGTMSFIRSDWGIDVTTAGMLMSIPALANLLIALPGGAIVSKFGVRKVWLLTLLWCLVFNVLGFFAPDFTTLSITRFCEGISIGLVFIVAPVIIAEAFPAEQRGLPMMLWSIWSTAGTLVALNLCNVVTPLLGWQANWLVIAVFLLIALVLNFLFCKVESDQVKAANNDVAKQGGQTKVKGAWGECLKSPVCVCICLVFFASVFAFDTFGTYYPTFLQSTLGIGAAESNTVSSVHTYLMAFICLTFGFVLNKIPNRHHPKIYLIAIAFASLGGILMWNMPTIPLDIVAILVCGAGMQIVGPMAHNLMPDAVSAKAVPIGMGMISFASGLGSMFGPFIAGRVVDITGNWGLLIAPMGIIALVGVGSAVVVLKRMYRNEAPALHDEELQYE